MNSVDLTVALQRMRLVGDITPEERGLYVLLKDLEARLSGSTTGYENDQSDYRLRLEITTPVPVPKPVVDLI